MQMKDELDARKKRVLQAIVDDYIESAEPVARGRWPGSMTSA